MDVIEAYARISVARGCGFALLAIFLAVLGLMGTPVPALKLAGILLLFVAVFLMLRSDIAQRINHRDTEVWLMLDAAQRPPPAIAQRVIGAALGRTFARFGLHFARAAAWVLGASFVLRVIA